MPYAKQPGTGNGAAEPGGNALDAQVRVRVSGDRMSAYLQIEPPLTGGRPPQGSDFDRALAQAGVAGGVDAALLDRLKSRPVYGMRFRIAAGVPPVNGRDGWVHLLFSEAAQGHPREKEDGAVDYRDLGFVRNVRKGEVLCRIAAPTAGTAGWNVVGETLAAAAGKAAFVPRGRNTALSPDGAELRAAIDGQVSFEDGLVHVLENYIVGGNVDNSTGNIRFIGGVTVLGSVEEGFEVESGGDVEIGGSVLGGKIRAKGGVTVRGGIVGMGRTEIRCEGDLSCLFMENCRAYAHGSIKTGNIFQCEIRCRGDLTLEGAHAKLVGGRCTVGGDLTADTIGSPASLATEIRLGADPDDAAALSEANKKFQSLAEQIGKLRQILALLDVYAAKGRLTEEKKNLRERSAASLAGAEAAVGKLGAEKEELCRRIDAAVKGKISCRGILHRGVSLTIGGSTLAVSRPIVRMELLCGEDGIRQVPLV